MPATPTPPPDGGILTEILARCRRREPAAQRALYERFASPMLGVCRRYAPSLADAEDVLQDAFVKIFERLDDFQDKGSFEGWVRRVVVSTAIDAWHRRRIRRVDFDLDDARHLPDPDANALDQLTFAEVRALIDQLPEGCRMVMLLYTVEGYSHAEVGDLLGISASASKAQLTRARQRLTAMVQANAQERQPSVPDSPAPKPASKTFKSLTALLFR